MSKPNYRSFTSEMKGAAIQMPSYSAGSTSIKAFPTFLCPTKEAVFWGTHLISSAHRYAVPQSAVYFMVSFQASQAAASKKSQSFGVQNKEISSPGLGSKGWIICEELLL